MPDDDYDDNDEDLDEDSPLGRTVKNLRKELKQAHKELREAKEGSQAAANAVQEIALLRAGLDLTPAKLKAFRAAHEGEWTPEAVLATAEELGFAQPKEDGAKKEELDALGRMNDAARGGQAPAPSDGITELDAIPTDLPEDEYRERVMATVTKHGGRTTWGGQ